MINLKKGGSYISGALITLFICALIMLLMVFWSAVANVQAFKNSARNVLDTYVTEQSVNIFDSIRESENGIVSFSADDYTIRLIAFCGLTEDSGTLKKFNPDLIYSVSRPTLTVESQKLNMKMACSVTVPLYFCGIKISDAVAPICINSSFADIF